MQVKLLFISLFYFGSLLSVVYAQAQNHIHDEKAAKVDFSNPDDVRTFPLGKVDLAKIGGAMIGRAVFQPGWKWSESVKPIAKTESCEAPHFQYHVSGILRIKMDDGTVLDCKAGDVSYLPMGHDAWVVGKDPVVVIDFHGMYDYAKANMGK